MTICAALVLQYDEISFFLGGGDEILSSPTNNKGCFLQKKIGRSPPSGRSARVQDCQMVSLGCRCSAFLWFLRAWFDGGAFMSRFFRVSTQSASVGLLFCGLVEFMGVCSFFKFMIDWLFVCVQMGFVICEPLRSGCVVCHQSPSCPKMGFWGFFASVLCMFSMKPVCRFLGFLQKIDPVGVDDVDARVCSSLLSIPLRVFVPACCSLTLRFRCWTLCKGAATGGHRILLCWSTDIDWRERKQQR